jgi:hypothetical protein
MSLLLLLSWQGLVLVLVLVVQCRQMMVDLSTMGFHLSTPNLSGLLRWILFLFWAQER